MKKWLYKMWYLFINKCPKCNGQLYCKGGTSETETCYDCGWTEWDSID